MVKGLTKEQVKSIQEYGCYSEDILADTLSKLLELEEWFGDYTVSDAISMVYAELAKMRKKKENTP